MAFVTVEHRKYLSPRRRDTSFRKQWIGRNANPKTLFGYCRDIWANLVRERDGNKCFMCGATQRLNSHHMITIKWLPTAFDPLCGIALCEKCHTVSLKSAHISPWFLEKKLATERPDQYRWITDHRITVSTDAQSVLDLRVILKELLDVFQKIKPVVFERSKYFKYSKEQEKQIVDEFKSERVPAKILMAKWGCSMPCFYEILERNGIKMSSKTEKTRTKKMMMKLRAHQVVKMDKNGRVLAEYPSISVASQEHKISPGGIWNCLKGHNKSANGFKWAYKKDLPKEKVA